MSDNIQSKIEQAREEARAACGENGDSSAACAVAWDEVEELQAEASHQKETEVPKTSFQQYCADNPEADECRVYED
jgi:hypothetical protein